MSKSSFFTGQPIFSQILNLLSKSDVRKVSRSLAADRYCKKFGSYEHLTVMMYAIFNRCTSIREVVTGLMACESKLFHLGVHYTIRRSTLSDANKRRTYEVFEQIYRCLYNRYHKFLPDSQSGKLRKKLFIIDSTTISLFQEILKAAGMSPVNGKRKGGIKAHTLISAQEDVPQLLCFSAGAANDITFMKRIALPSGSIIVCDRAYHDYKELERWTREGITWVSRTRRGMVIEKLFSKDVTDYQHHQGVKSDALICLGHNHGDKITKVQARLVTYYDSASDRTFEFITNNLDYSPVTIAQLYKQRWQIETLFKRVKQNYPLRNFFGDNENAIKIQIWCAVIADLLLKIVQARATKKWSFANLRSIIRLHLMTYINLFKFLNKPEKTLLQSISRPRPAAQPKLFIT